MCCCRIGGFNGEGNEYGMGWGLSVRATSAIPPMTGSLTPSSGATALMVPAEKVVLDSPDDSVGEDLRASAAGR